MTRQIPIDRSVVRTTDHVIARFAQANRGNLKASIFTLFRQKNQTFGMRSPRRFAPRDDILRGSSTRSAATPRGQPQA